MIEDDFNLAVCELALQQWQEAFRRAEDALIEIEQSPADVATTCLGELVQTAANLRLEADLMLAEVARLHAAERRRSEIRVRRHVGGPIK